MRDDDHRLGARGQLATLATLVPAGTLASAKSFTLGAASTLTFTDRVTTAIAMNNALRTLEVGRDGNQTFFGATLMFLTAYGVFVRVVQSRVLEAVGEAGRAAGLRRVSHRDMSPVLVVQARPTVRLDYSFMRRVFLGLGAALTLIAPLSRDPVALAAGGMVPWLVLVVIGIRTMPAAIVYVLLWQWLQVFARVVLTLVDGEALGRGLYGPNVEHAYWYMLASILVLACMFRLCLHTLRSPTPEDRLILHEWRPSNLLSVYGVAQVASTAALYAYNFVPALSQQLEALARVKVVAIFVLFNTIMVTGKGGRLLLAVVGFEIMLGFSGILSDFREVFIFLAIAALASRIKWSGTMTAGAVVWIVVLVGLALFWTSVKADFRQFATGSDESQNVRTGLAERMGFLSERAIAIDRLDWGGAAYGLLVRLAYVDIFGSVIGVSEVSPEGGFGRQWTDAVEHIVKPRILFPDKAALSDTEVYMRLAHGDASEQMRLGTSISVGYMAENFADFGFPGMLLGIAALGLMMGAVCRFFMTRRQLPWSVREGIVVAFAFTVGRDGVEISLPKIMGGTLMFFLVYVLLVRMAFPYALRWLQTRAAFQQPAPS